MRLPRLSSIFALLAFTALALAQGAIQQSGPVTPGHPPVWISNGLLGDPGPAAGTSGPGLSEEFLSFQGIGTPPYSSAGSGPLGANWCDYDGPPWQSSGWHFFCISPSSNGAGLIEYGNAGTANPQPLTLCVNSACGTLEGGTGGINVANIASLRASGPNFTGSGVVNVASYYGNTYYGGGTFSLGISGCADNGGTVIKDTGNNCWYRQNVLVSQDVTTWGAHCDGVTTVNDATVNAGSNQLTSASITFQSTDVGKYVVLNPSTAGVGPFLTTITAVSGSTATLATNAPNVYPGTTSVSQINYVTTINGGVDSPGTGYVPGDVLSVTGGTYSVAATANVPATGLVSVTQTAGGSGYQVNDLIALTSTTANTVTIAPAIVQVTSVNGAGAITGFSIVDYGIFRSNTSHINPAAFSQSGGHGSGWTFTLAASNGSFGVAVIQYVTGGTYTVAPPSYASPTTDGGVGGGGTGATVDTVSGVATWSYFSDDTTALNNVETYLESAVTRGLYGSASIPSGKNCFANYLIVNQPVTWKSDGQRQGQLTMILGSAGNSLYSARPAFVTVGSTLPSPGHGPIGQAQVRFEDIQISGMSSATTVNINGTPTSTSTDCMEFARPTGNHGNIEIDLENFESDTCPGNLVSTTYWSGEIIGHNVRLNGGGGDCLHLEKASNPTRIYRLVVGGCNIPINLVNTSAAQFFGVAEQRGGTVGISVTGSFNKAAYARFYGMDNGGNQNEGMYQDASGLTVTCDGCRFGGNNQSGITGATDADITIGPDVQGGANSTGGPFPALILNNGMFQNSTATNNIGFAQSPGATYCGCVVIADGGTRNVTQETLATTPATAIALGLLTGPQFTSPPAGQYVLGPVTVSNLPTCNAATKNFLYSVSDASSPTYLGTLTGGSTTAVTARCNGSAWVAD